jgi:hypothetical protein
MALAGSTGKRFNASLLLLTFKLSRMHDADGGLGTAFPMPINIKSTLHPSPARHNTSNRVHTHYNKKFIAFPIYNMAQQPDLQAILATLAQYSQQNNAGQPPQQTPYQPVPPIHATPSIPENNNLAAILQNARVESPVSADPRLRGRPQSRSITPAQPPKQDQVQPPSVIDPATITVWQDALRCVTKIAAQNKMFEATIRRVSLFLVTQIPLT